MDGSCCPVAGCDRGRAVRARPRARSRGAWALRPARSGPRWRCCSRGGAVARARLAGGLARAAIGSRAIARARNARAGCGPRCSADAPRARAATSRVKAPRWPSITPQRSRPMKRASARARVRCGARAPGRARRGRRCKLGVGGDLGRLPSSRFGLGMIVAGGAARRAADRQLASARPAFGPVRRSHPRAARSCAISRGGADRAPGRRRRRARWRGARCAVLAPPSCRAR